MSLFALCDLLESNNCRNALPLTCDKRIGPSLFDLRSRRQHKFCAPSSVALLMFVLETSVRVPLPNEEMYVVSSVPSRKLSPRSMPWCTVSYLRPIPRLI